MLSKRNFLLGATALGGLAAFRIGAPEKAEAAAETFEIVKTEEEWRAQLTPMQYAVLREEATERPFTSPLLEIKAEGTYHCAGCDQALFESVTKFDSRTGWPSYWKEIPGKVAYKTDFKLIYPRTEEHCSRCGGHLGHVFDDGPPPTGKRHCINGVAMVFRPADGGEAVMG